MKPRLAAILAWSIAGAAGCGHETGPPPTTVVAPPPPPVASLPPTVTLYLGAGPIAVYGANVYSPGQGIYQALRQEDSLMAFLTCQGEPDRVEVRENESPGAPPLIFLEYTRRGVARGTVEIEPTESGFYAAHPLDPSGSLKTAKPPAEGLSHPVKTAPKPKQPAPAPGREPRPREPEPEPARESPPPETPAPAPAARPDAPRPTAAQSDECPIEPWRVDCRSLCVAGATWEWCSYRD